MHHRSCEWQRFGGSANLASTKSSYSLRRPPNRYANAREYGSGFARRKTGASYSSTLARTQFLLDASAFANRSHRLVLGTPSSRLATSKKSSCRAWLCMAIGLLIASKRCAKDASRCDSTDYLRAQRVSASPLRKSALALQAHCSPKSVATALRRRSDPERCRP